MTAPEFVYPKNIIVHSGPVPRLDYASLLPLHFHVFAEVRPFRDRPPSEEPPEIQVSEFLMDWFKQQDHRYHPNGRIDVPFGLKYLSAHDRDTLGFHQVNVFTERPGFGPILMGQEIKGTHTHLCDLRAFGTLIREIRNFSSHPHSLVHSLLCEANGELLAYHHMLHHLESIKHYIMAYRLLFPNTQLTIDFAGGPSSIFDVRGHAAINIVVGHLSARLELSREVFRVHLGRESFDLLKNVFTLDQIGTGELVLFDFEKARAEFDTAIQSEPQETAAIRAAGKLAEYNSLPRENITVAFQYIVDGVIENE